MARYSVRTQTPKLFSLTVGQPGGLRQTVRTVVWIFVAWQIVVLSFEGRRRVAAQVAVYPGVAYPAAAPAVAVPAQVASSVQVVTHQRPVQPHRLIHVVNVRRADGTRETRIFTGPQAALPAKQLVPTTGEVVSHSVQRAEVPRNAGLGWSVGKDVALAGVPVEQSYVSPDLVIQEDQPGTGATIAVQSVGGNMGRGAVGLVGGGAVQTEKDKSTVNVAPPPAEPEEPEEPETEGEPEQEQEQEPQPEEEEIEREEPHFQPPKSSHEPVEPEASVELPPIPPPEIPPIDLPSTGIREGLRRHKAAVAIGPHHIIQPVNVFHPHRSHIGFAVPLLECAGLGTFLIVSWGALESSALWTRRNVL